jgi:hypothetical protein
MFLAGLVLLVWASDQSRSTRIVTAALTGLIAFGLVVVSLWFSLEGWAYRHFKGEKWLWDIAKSAASWKPALFRGRAPPAK